MNLYRIDLTRPDGSDAGALRDLLGPRLIRRWEAARVAAIDAANDPDRPVFAHITRISGAGRIQRVGIVAPGSRRVWRG